MKPKRHPDSLFEAIAPLAKQVAAIQDQMRAQGLFPHDRELLECQGCGLKEDVTHDGWLITCREPDFGNDTGLRFTARGVLTYTQPALLLAERGFVAEQQIVIGDFAPHSRDGDLLRMLDELNLALVA